MPHPQTINQFNHSPFPNHNPPIPQPSCRKAGSTVRQSISSTIPHSRIPNPESRIPNPNPPIPQPGCRKAGSTVRQLDNSSVHPFPNPEPQSTNSLDWPPQGRFDSSTIHQLTLNHSPFPTPPNKFLFLLK